MAGLEHDRSIHAGLAESDQHPPLSPSLEKKGLPVDDDDDDSVHEGLEFPTEEELVTLRRVSDAIPWPAYSEWSLHLLLIVLTFGSDRLRGVGRAFLCKCFNPSRPSTPSNLCGS